MRLSAVVLLSVVLPTGAAASTFGSAANGSCAASRLTTCASVQVQYVRLGMTTAPILALGSVWLQRFGSETEVHGFRFDRLPGQQLTGDLSNPQIIAKFWNDGEDHHRRECEVMGRECRGEAVVTPEPVTMTLLATGLVGMAGAARVRRRMKKQNDV